MAGPTLLVDPPTREKRVGGLSGVVEFRENDRLSHVEGLVFQSDGCQFPDTEESRCLADAPVPDKKFAGTSTADGINAPVTLYAGVKCFAAPNADEAERARLALEEGRDQVLEKLLGEWGLAGTSVNPSSNVKGAVGQVEQALDKGYRGRGIILMSRLEAVDAGLEYTDGEYLRTKLGTPVIASGWIQPGAVIGVGSVTIEHGEVVERDAYEPLKNTHSALAEQVYSILVDCEFRVVSATTNT